MKLGQVSGVRRLMEARGAALCHEHPQEAKTRTRFCDYLGCTTKHHASVCLLLVELELY